MVLSKTQAHQEKGFALASCNISSVFLTRHSALQDIWHQTHWEGPGPGSTAGEQGSTHVPPSDKVLAAVPMKVQFPRGSSDGSRFTLAQKPQPHRGAALSSHLHRHGFLASCKGQSQSQVTPVREPKLFTGPGHEVVQSLRSDAHTGQDYFYHMSVTW